MTELARNDRTTRMVRQPLDNFGTCLNVERALKRAVTPLTTPQARRWLIATRNKAVRKAAQVRGSRHRDRMRPTFIIAGAQKAGTTYLY